ncbi:MAG: DNA topoisomerase I [Candidatus Thermoplasmatota archaeon]
MKLVICEKNIAAQRIAYILSEGKAKIKIVNKVPVYEFLRDDEPWVIIGLKGHILSVDYPSGFNQWTKISPHDLINVEPVKKISEKNIAQALKSLVDHDPFVIIATDYDREGELIGVEAANILKQYKPELQVKRARFSAITPYEIKKAFDNITDVDYNLASAAEARQIIDLVWGAVLTRFISLTSRRFGKDFLSIGRVQSPTLALLVEREREIKNFQPKPYWQIIAKLAKDVSFDAQHEVSVFWDENDAKKIYDKIKDAEQASIIKVEKVINKEMPPPPFNTTMFLQAASNIGFSASKAMSIAEELYMLGYISYPRTDNTVYPSSLNIKGILYKLSNTRFNKEVEEVLKNGREYPTRGSRQATDHPPIHPVDAPSKKLSSDQDKIYELICRRFLATLAKDAVSETTKVILNIKDEGFKAEGYRLIESNWKDIYRYIGSKRVTLPELSEGERITVKDIKLKNDYTKPPQRYSQGALIAKMEQLALGTKSTRHEIISKLYSRKYVVGSPPVPSSTAMAVVDALSHCDVVKPDMTARLENDMDDIANGKKTLSEIVKESRMMLTEVMKTLEVNKESIKNNINNAVKEQNTVGKCPRCGKDMLVRISKKGKRFVGCTGYPSCSNTYSLPQNGSLSMTSKVCDKCNSPVIQVKMKGKKVWNLCVNPDCPSKNKDNKSKDVDDKK